MYNKLTLNSNLGLAIERYRCCASAKSLEPIAGGSSRAESWVLHHGETQMSSGMCQGLDQKRKSRRETDGERGREKNIR